MRLDVTGMFNRLEKQDLFTKKKTRDGSLLIHEHYDSFDGRFFAFASGGN